MVQMLQQQELELSVDEKSFILEFFKKNKKKFNIKTKKDSNKTTLNLSFKNTVINDLVNKLSLKYFGLNNLDFSFRLHKYVENLTVPEHIDKTLFTLVYQLSDIPGLQYLYNNKWNDFHYHDNKMLLCFDEKSTKYGYVPTPHRFYNDKKELRYSLTIHVDENI